MNRRQTGGGETWSRLCDWSRGQTASERLAAQILRNEGYESIDPSHPLGGQDGLKDVVCIKDTMKFVGASYFPRGQKPFNTIKKKFVKDLEGIAPNNAEGIAFVTNQELRLSERKELVEKASSSKVDLFHLERISSVLDSPQCYGIRLEFLDIEMTKEEQLAFMAILSQWTSRFDEILAYINKSDIIREELNRLLLTQDKPKAPKYVTPLQLPNPLYYTGSVDRIKRCSHCKYGYLIKGQITSIASYNIAFSCPKCGNVE